MMKAITILQPWASLIACGAKQIETRSWATKYRGKIAIHTGKGTKNIILCKRQIFWSNLWTYEIAAEYTLQQRIDNFLPLGAVIAIADLVDCLQVQEIRENMQGDWFAVLKDRTVEGKELAFGDYTPGRYAWILDNIQAIKPVPAKGMQRIWNWAGEAHV